MVTVGSMVMSPAIVEKHCSRRRGRPSSASDQERDEPSTRHSSRQKASVSITLPRVILSLPSQPPNTALVRQRSTCPLHRRKNPRSRGEAVEVETECGRVLAPYGSARSTPISGGHETLW